MTKKQLISFIILVAGAGTIYKLSGLKDVFYVPMQEHMGLSHQQIGVAMSAFGLSHIVFGITSIYISDRFSKKYLIPFSLIGVGLVGIYLSTMPSYTGVLISYALLALFSEVIFWPVLLKAIRLIGNSSNQGRLFGFLEAGRGVFDTLVAATALGIFAVMGGGILGFKNGILFYSGVVIIIGILSYFVLEHDYIEQHDKSGNYVGKNKAVWQNMLEALKMLEIWIVALIVFSCYTVYCGITYFIPFLKDTYMLSPVLVGAYGIINQYALKMLAGPTAGYIVDKKTKSATKYLRIALLIAFVMMLVFVFLPFKKMDIYVTMIFTLSFAAVIFTMRATYMAPVDEIRVPKKISGSAMSIACALGYSPQFFSYPMYGFILDTFPGITGYRIIFSMMAFFAFIGVIVATILIKRLNKNKIYYK